MTKDYSDHPVNQTLDGVLFLTIFFIGFKLFFIPWITGDGLSYFTYLRSVVVDGDLNFRNEFDYVGRWGTGRIQCGGKETVTGYVGNCFPIGPAILWSPFYVPSYLLHESLFSGKPHAGYGKNEVFAVGFATMFYSLLGIFLLYDLLQKFTSRLVAFFATLVSWLATPLVYYMYHEPGMSHGLSFFTVTLFLYVWFTRREKTWVNFILLGACGGLMALVRWQDALFLVIPLLDNAVLVRRGLKGGEQAYASDLASKIIVLLVVAFLVFLPQIIAWRIIYGSYGSILNALQHRESLDWTHPHILEVLFSLKHGLLSWTPAYTLACLGLYTFYRKEKETALYIIIALILQLGLNSVLSAWHWDWAFGSRGMVNSIPIFALGMAYLLESAKTGLRILIVILFISTVVWNLLLLVQVSYAHWLIDPNVPYQQIVDNQLTNAPELARRLVRERLGV